MNKMIYIGLLILMVLLVRYWYFKPKYISGETAPDFEVELKNGSKLRLSSLKGKYVLLDFWGSWCGPCRAENPALRQLVEAYKNKSYSDASGLEILSIGIETNQRAWESAILADGLNWENHTSSLQRFDEPVALLYKVRQIPTKYLINPEGVIVLSDASLEQIKQFLNKKVRG